MSEQRHSFSNNLLSSGEKHLNLHLQDRCSPRRISADVVTALHLRRLHRASVTTETTSRVTFLAELSVLLFVHIAVRGAAGDPQRLEQGSARCSWFQVLMETQWISMWTCNLTLNIIEATR